MATSPSLGKTFRAVFDKVITYKGTLNLGSAAANDAADSFASADVTVRGAALGDFVLVSLGVDTVDTTVTAKVTAANTVTVTVHNGTTDAVDLASTTVYIAVLKPSASAFIA